MWEGESTLKQACYHVTGSAMCVQRLDDSHSAIRITYRISLRSSSSQEPRYPLLKVVSVGILVRSASYGGAAAICRGCKRLVRRVYRVWRGFVLWWKTGAQHGAAHLRALRPCHRNVRRAASRRELALAPRVHSFSPAARGGWRKGGVGLDRVVMILPQVHLRKPCYDFTFL